MEIKKRESNVFYRSMKKYYPIITKAEGIYLYDEEGNRFIDGTGGPAVVNIGHGVKEVNDAIYEQLQKVAYAHNAVFTTQVQEDLAKKVASWAPPYMNRVFFVSGGSEAVESAIKLARQYQLETGNPQKHKVISLWQSFHGSSPGALSLTMEVKRKSHFLPLLGHFPHLPSAYCYRCHYEKTYPECNLFCATFLEKVIKQEGKETISAFIVEPIQGVNGGGITPPPEYFSLIREICDRYQILMIADEVITGFGRTGKAFGIMHWAVTPDIITCAKGICSGYVPMGAMVVHERVVQGLQKGSGEFAHGFTFNGSAAGCAASLAVLNYIESKDLINRSREMGDYLKSRLEKTIRSSRIVGDIRGKGLFVGIEFVADKGTRNTFDGKLKVSEKISDKMKDKGVLIRPINGYIDGSVGDCVFVSPPFIVTKEQIDEMCIKLAESITETEQEVLRFRT